MKRALLAVVLWCLPTSVFAQLANPSSIHFVSADQTTTIPPGQTNAGQPSIASYQGSIFLAAADVSTGVPVSVGPVVSKTLATVVAGTTPTQYNLSFAQLGLTGASGIPVCNQLPCPQYTLLLVAIGPNGTSAKAVASESDSFTAALPVQGPAPAGPTVIRVQP